MGNTSDNKISISESRVQKRIRKKQFLILEIDSLVCQIQERLGKLSHLESGCDVDEFCSDGGSK